MNKLREYWEKINEWLKERTRREQILLGGCGVVLALLLIYEIFIGPLENWLQEKQQAIITQQVILANMQQLAQQIKTFPKNFISSQTISLQTLQMAIKQNGLAQNISQIQQLSNNQVSFQVSNLQFDRLMQFLINIAKQYNWQVSQLTLQSDATLGTVKGSIVLS